MPEDIRITRLAVIMCRDPNWERMSDLGAKVDYALLYVGIPTSVVGTTLSSPRTPIGLSQIFNLLTASGLLGEFLTQILQDYRPTGIQSVTFVQHLQALGLDWDRTSNQIRPTATHPEEERRLRTELAALLAEVDSSYPSRLQGAWVAYFSDNPDRYRQSITSCRELLRQVIDELGEGATRREKILMILGSSLTSEVADAAAGLVSSIYDAQSAGTHSGLESATALFVLVETEHVLYFLLRHREIE